MEKYCRCRVSKQKCAAFYILYSVQCTISQTSLCPDSLKEDESEAKIEQPSQQKRSCQDFLNQGETDRDK